MTKDIIEPYDPAYTMGDVKYEVKLKPHEEELMRLCKFADGICEQMGASGALITSRGTKHTYAVRLQELRTDITLRMGKDCVLSVDGITRTDWDDNDSLMKQAVVYAVIMMDKKL